MATTDVNEDKVIRTYIEKVARDKLIAELTANNVINGLVGSGGSGEYVLPAAVDSRQKATLAVDDKTIKVDYEILELNTISALGEKELKRATEAARQSLISATVNSNAPVLGVNHVTVPYPSGGTTAGVFVPSPEYEYVCGNIPYTQRDASGTVMIGQKAIPRSLDVSYCIETEVSPPDGKGHTVEMISTLDAAFYGEKLMERYDETVKGKVADKTVVRVSATAAFKLGLMDAGIFWNSDKTACVRRVAFVVETPILARDVKSADEIMAEMNKE